VDADALAALPLPATVARIVTPHDGELARWLGAAVPEGALERLQYVAGAARTRQVTLLAKGPATVIATPAGALYVNTTGTPALATAGSGDVLAGAIGALLAQGLAPERAAGFGAWMHGMAGQAAARQWGAGVMAHDIAGELGRALDRAATYPTG
jgi:NAD(P)H-hydrate epimerase